VPSPIAVFLMYLRNSFVTNGLDKFGALSPIATWIPGKEKYPKNPFYACGVLSPSPPHKKGLRLLSDLKFVLMRLVIHRIR